MIQSEIREKAKALQAELRAAQSSIVEIQGRMHALILQCDHPDMRQYVAMGELGWKCPDCGKQT